MKLGPWPARKRLDEMPAKIYFCDAAALLQLHDFFPGKANLIEMSRLKFFSMRLNGQLVLIATTPIEEMLIDDWKEQGYKPDLNPFKRFGSGVGVVKQFDDMRTSEYLIQTFTMDKVSCQIRCLFSFSH